MSSEERDDMVEDQSSEEATEEVEDYEGIYEVDETEEEAADSFDYDAGGSRRGGSSAGIWVIIILVIAALAALAANQVMQKRAREEAEKQAQDRKGIRERAVQLIAEDVGEAEAALQAGDLGRMLEVLARMDEQLKIQADSANQAGDTEEAQRLAGMRKPIQDTIGQVRAEYEEVQARMEALEAAAAENMQSVRGAFAGYRLPDSPLGAEQPAGDEEAAGGEEPAEGEQPAEGEDATGEPAAAGDEAAAGEEAPAEEAPAEEAPAEEAPAEEAAEAAAPESDVEVAPPEEEPAGVPPGN